MGPDMGHESVCGVALTEIGVSIRGTAANRGLFIWSPALSWISQTISVHCGRESEKAGFEFETVARRAGIACLDGGDITSNAGTLLLGKSIAVWA
jgi:hypothetical protein